MEIGDVIKFDGESYTVQQIFKSSPGNAQSIVNSDKPVGRKGYYIVKKGDKKYWIKEYLRDKDKLPDFEFEQTRNVQDIEVNYKDIVIKAAVTHAYDGKYILMEYYADYIPLCKYIGGFSTQKRIDIRNAVHTWLTLSKNKLTEYDFNLRNILVKVQGSELIPIKAPLKLLMIDFEHAPKCTYMSKTWQNTFNKIYMNKDEYGAFRNSDSSI